MSSHYLKVNFSDRFFEEDEVTDYRYRLTPFAAVNTLIFSSRVESSQKLTGNDDVKTVYKLGFDLKDVNWEFLPGDTVGVLPSNNGALVDEILLRLNLESVSDKLCELKVQEGTLKKNAAVPKHLPPKSTLRKIFLHHVDVRSPPKKLFLKSLSRFVKDPQERINLDQLCSPKSSQYPEFITSSGSTLLGLLEVFPSCTPPIEVLLEHLPPLLPRPYSISSSSLSGTLEITFFVLERDDGTKGVCTGWLEDLTTSPTTTMVPFYFRQPTKFRFDTSGWVILVATGTGLAPFRGFIQHSELGHKATKIWLFYGCRYHDRDFLFQEELEEWEKSGIISRLDVACSRDTQSKCYVQDLIEKNREQFRDWWFKNQARIFVCGGGNTVRDVKRTVGNTLGCREGYVDEMVTAGRFITDSWF